MKVPNIILFWSNFLSRSELLLIVKQFGSEAFNWRQRLCFPDSNNNFADIVIFSFSDFMRKEFPLILKYEKGLRMILFSSAFVWVSLNKFSDSIFPRARAFISSTLRALRLSVDVLTRR